MKFYSDKCADISDKNEIVHMEQEQQKLMVQEEAHRAQAAGSPQEERYYEQ
jgi:hypothetical protein